MSAVQRNPRSLAIPCGHSQEQQNRLTDEAVPLHFWLWAVVCECQRTRDNTREPVPGVARLVQRLAHRLVA